MEHPRHSDALRSPVDTQRPRPTSASDVALGLLPQETQAGLQQDMVKELVNKLAWVLGSTYRVPYSNQKSTARSYAWRIAKSVLRDHGYPSKISLLADPIE